MLKQLFTTVRGRRYEAMEAVVDRNALPLLRQQIRDCAHAVEMSRKAVAVAMAQNEQERKQFDRLVRQIEDLETRTLDALEKGREDLAHDAADAIAHLEAERDTSSAAQERFREEIARLRSVLRDSEARLRQLQRGQRLAQATDKTQKMQAIMPDAGLTTLREAEATLDRLQTRQAELDATARAMTELESTGNADTIRDRLAAEGCGTPLKSDADSVLERLKARKADQKQD
ncbi:PspA/IM30 family protein [Mesobacterium pallidum]|uniref:PspA/IM30 family protein n=1 Tax=Mesobacterium pallidum TaxID=2872037 RepID=UPI001EE37713|nr:PspA/IM30 family protein [Mesobacterium pallidum]